jgi:hypothetical protein
MSADVEAAKADPTVESKAEVVKAAETSTGDKKDSEKNGSDAKGKDDGDDKSK